MPPPWRAWFCLSTNTAGKRSLPSLFRGLICIIIYGCVCVYLLDTMRAFQWLALGSAVGSAVALTPEYVRDHSPALICLILFDLWAHSDLEN